MDTAGGMDWLAKRLEGKIFTLHFIDSTGQIHLEGYLSGARIRSGSQPECKRRRRHGLVRGMEAQLLGASGGRSARIQSRQAACLAGQQLRQTL